MITEDSTLNFNSVEMNPGTSSSLNKDIGNRKRLLPDYFPGRSEVKKTNISKMVQVSLGDCVSDDNLSSVLPSDNYWRLVAEKKRIQLKDALDENERLYNVKASLVQQMMEYKEMLEEMNSFIDVFKTVAQDVANDTGIDVEDLNESSVQ